MDCKASKAEQFFFFVVRFNSYTISEFFVLRSETIFFYKKFGLGLRIRISRFYKIRNTIFTEVSQSDVLFIVNLGKLPLPMYSLVIIVILIRPNCLILDRIIQLPNFSQKNLLHSASYSENHYSPLLAAKSKTIELSSSLLSQDAI